MDDVEKRALLLGDSSAIEDAFEALKTLKPFQSILISQELQIPLMSEQGDPVPPSKTIQSCENGTKIWPAYERIYMCIY